MWSDMLQLVPTLLPSETPWRDIPTPRVLSVWILSNVQHSNMKRLEILKVTFLN